MRVEVQGFVRDGPEKTEGDQLVNGGWGCWGVKKENGELDIWGWNVGTEHLKGMDLCCFGWEGMYVVTEEGHKLQCHATPELEWTSIEISQWTTVKQISAGQRAQVFHIPLFVDRGGAFVMSDGGWECVVMGVQCERLPGNRIDGGQHICAMHSRPVFRSCRSRFQGSVLSRGVWNAA